MLGYIVNKTLERDAIMLGYIVNQALEREAIILGYIVKQTLEKEIIEAKTRGDKAAESASAKALNTFNDVILYGSSE